MTFNVEHSRAEIRQAMRESVGWGHSYSLKDAEQITGLHRATLYQIADGTNKQPERHLPRLLDIPAFFEKYAAIKGHACTYLGNHTGCELEAIGSFMEATGEAGKAVAD